MPSFRFVTPWVIAAPIDELFDALRDYPRWPEWWPGADRMLELEPVDSHGLGGLGSYTWRSPLGYRLRFEGTSTRVDRPHRLTGDVHGELEGEGAWTLSALDDGAVQLVYEWNVCTTKRWMSLLSPILRPVFVANHDRLMRGGARGLAGRVGGRLVSGG